MSIIFLILLIIGHKYTMALLKDSNEQAVLKEGEFRRNKDGSTSIGYNMASLGFYNIETGKRIKNGSLIKPVDGKINGRIYYQQNYPEGFDYILIAMVDYKKHNFVIDGVTYEDYSFSLDKKDEINIDISVEGLDKDAKEFTFFLVKDIHVKALYEKEKENLTMWMLRETKYSFAQRFLLRESIMETRMNNSDSYNEFITNKDFIIDLVKTHNIYEPMPIYQNNSGDELEVVIQNKYDTEMNYAVFGFLDWEQILIDGDSPIKYIEIPSKASIYFKVKIPEISENKSFQIYYIPQVNSNAINGFYPESTYKTILTQ
ncbi:MAG: hypothetical protein N4A50_13720 [Vallitalea sp.]|jgi:hypothetical protein|nr:hypothetical protein [Vallitalea sp.]